MSRAYHQQRKKDDAAFPVRLIAGRTPAGHGLPLDADPITLLRTLLGNGNYAWYPHNDATGRSTDSLAVYFRSLEDAARWLAATEGLIELVDGTTSTMYSSPYVSDGVRHGMKFR